MAEFSDIPGGLRLPQQAFLDAKTWSLSEVVLSDLGEYNNLAYTYGEGLKIYCQTEKTTWEWREAKESEVGLLDNNFQYATGWVANEKDYSDLFFNFFKEQIEESLEQLKTTLSVIQKDLLGGSGAAGALARFTEEGKIESSRIVDNGDTILVGEGVDNGFDLLQVFGNLLASTIKVESIIRSSVKTSNFIDLNIGGGIGFYTDFQPAMRIASSTRNILIGTTIDNGVDKLQVNGGANFNGTVSTNTIRSANSDLVISTLSGGGNNGTITAQALNIILRTSVANTILFAGGYNKSTVIKGYNNTFPVTLQEVGGNVLIGTTTDNGVDKLQVNGSAIIKSNTYGHSLTLGSLDGSVMQLGADAASGGSPSIKSLTGTLILYANSADLNKSMSLKTSGIFLGAGYGSIFGEGSQNYINYSEGGSGNLKIATTVANSILFLTNNLERARFSTSGNFLIGTSVDNGVDALQVNGTISAMPATLSTQVVVKSQLDLKSNDTEVVKLSGDQTIDGVKYFKENLKTRGTLISSGLQMIGYENSYGTMPTWGADGYIINSGSTLINGFLDFKYSSSAGVRASSANLSLQALLNITFSTASSNVFSDPTTSADEHARITYYGNFLVNTIADNGLDKIQVDGTISAYPGVLDNQVVIKSQLDLKAPISGSANYIRASVSSVQQGGFNISGQGFFGDSVQATKNITINGKPDEGANLRIRANSTDSVIPDTFVYSNLSNSGNSIFSQNITHDDSVYRYDKSGRGVSIRMNWGGIKFNTFSNGVAGDVALEDTILELFNSKTAVFNGPVRFSTLAGTTTRRLLIASNGAITSGPEDYTYENVLNKQNNLVVDGTGLKYATVDAIRGNSLLLSENQTVTGIKSFLNRLLVGTTTDNGIDALQVAGSARFSSSVTSTKNIINNFGGGSALDLVFSGVTVGEIRTSAYNLLIGTPTGGGQALVFQSAGIERARFANSTGNLLVNTITDNGIDKLQVQGSASFTSNVTATNGIFSGNVGIGITTPSRKLHVNGATRISRLDSTSQFIDIETGEANSARLRFFSASNNQKGLEIANYISGNIEAGVMNFIEFRTGLELAALTRMKIDYLGNIGINTNSPNTRLDVFGRVKFGTGLTDTTSFGGMVSSVSATNTQNSLFLLQAGIGSAHLGFKPNDSNLYFVNSYTSGLISDTTSMVLATTGNLLISTTVDNGIDKLQVQGSASFSSSVSASNGTLIGGDLITNYLPKAIGVNSLGDSLLYDNGSSIGIGTNLINAAFKLRVFGSAMFGDATQDAQNIVVEGTTYASTLYRNSQNFYIAGIRAGGSFTFTNGRNNANVFSLGIDATSGRLGVLGNNLSLNGNGVGRVGIGWSNGYTIPEKFTVVGEGTTSLTSTIKLYNSSLNTIFDFKDSGTLLIGTTVDNGIDKLQVNGSSYFNGDLTLYNGSDSVRLYRGAGAAGRLIISRPGGTSVESVSFGGGNDEIRIRGLGSIRHTGADFQFGNSGGGKMIFDASTGQLVFRGSGNQPGLTMFPITKNILLQDGGTIEDLGYRLDINGTFRAQENSYLNTTLLGTTVDNGTDKLQVLGSTNLNGNTTITGILNVSGSILQNGGALALQDGTILYHSLKWFTPTSTISTNGTTVTSIGTQFNSEMVGAKLTINGEVRIITTYSNTTNVIVDNAYNVSYSGVVADSWGVYSKSFENIASDNTRNNFYGHKGRRTIFTDSNDNYFVTSLYAVFNNLEASSLALKGGQVSVTSLGQFTFNSTNNYTSVKDLGLRRNTAGILEIHDGITSTGSEVNRRDLLARNLFGSTVILGTTVDNGIDRLQVQGSTSLNGNTTINGILNITPTLSASANNDILVGLNIAPIFSNGGFTGVNNVGLNMEGILRLQPTTVVPNPTPWDIYVATEVGNPNNNALYIAPTRGSNPRVYLGSPTRSIYSLNLSYCNTIENAPSYSVGSFSIGSQSSHSILRTNGTNVVYSATGPSSNHVWNGGPNYSGFNEYMRLTTIGNLLVGTATDNGIDALQVSGSALFTSNITAKDGVFSGNVGIGTGSGAITAKLHVNGRLLIVSDGETATFGNLNYSTKYLQVRDGSNYAVRWGLQANNNITNSGTALMMSSKTISFKANAGGTSFENVVDPDLIINSDFIGIGSANPLTHGGTAKLSVVITNTEPIVYGRSSTDAIFIRRINVGNYQFQTTANGGNTGNLFLQPYGGNVLIGTTVDNGVNALQVNGTISANPATSNNQVVIKSQLDLKADSSDAVLLTTNQSIAGTKRFLSDITITDSLDTDFITIGLGGGRLISNSAFGITSLFRNTTGAFNSAYGRSSMNNNTTGSENTGIGRNALFYQTSGSRNVSIGAVSGQNAGSNQNKICDDSTFVGYNASPKNSSETNQIVIGYNAGGLGSNTSTLGNASTVFARIWGRNLIGTSIDNGVDALQVNGTASFSSSVTANGFIGAGAFLMKGSNSTIGAGNNTGDASFLSQDGLYGMYFGSDPNSGKSSIQVKRNDSNVLYHLHLNPIGGSVILGQSESSISSTGVAKFTSLAGTGKRTVVSDENGNLTVGRQVLTYGGVAGQQRPLLPSETGCLIICNGTSSNSILLNTDYSIGEFVDIIRDRVSGLSFVAGANVLIKSRGSLVSVMANGMVRATYISIGVWFLSGDLQ
jgi:hypothetical protein